MQMETLFSYFENHLFACRDQIILNAKVFCKAALTITQ